MKKRAAKNISFNNVISAFLIMITICGQPQKSYAQIRSGAAFLKILPGARQQGMANSLTGAVGEMLSLYANPAATGFLREWEWSGTYSKWLADIYNISLNYGKNLPTFWSRNSHFVFGMNYLGVKEFDSTLRTRPAVAANDLLFVFGYGNPLNIISNNISLGANVKYLQSNLAEFNANTIIYDLGLLAKTNRFNFISGLCDYAILSGGIALTQLGHSLNFKSVATPLPRTWSAGAALNFGSHNGVQIQLAADYKLVHDEIGSYSLGAEVSWGYRFAIRGGYNFNDYLLSKLSLGFSVCLDDYSTMIKNNIAGHNHSLRADLASLESNEFFSASYRGTINLYPIGPEKFDLINPASHDTLEGGETKFAWEISRDPDLYDDVNYYLLLERNRKADKRFSPLCKLLEISQNEDYEFSHLIEQARSELFLVENSNCNVNAPEHQVTLSIQKLPTGDYFWTVVAYDRDGHFRVSDSGIKSFQILWPDIQIKQLEFQPHPWITECDTQGVISAQIENNGKIKTENILVTVESSEINKNLKPTNSAIIFQTKIRQLNAHDVYKLAFNWLESEQGARKIDIHARIIEPDKGFGKESNLKNNDSCAVFYTIPKGHFAIDDTVTAFIIPHTQYDVPFANRIFFDLNCSEVKSSYYCDSDWIYPPFRVLADRLKKRNDIYLKIEGFADSTTAETLDIAKKRVESIRDILLILGVQPKQLPLNGLTWHLSADKKMTVNEDVQEERRYARLIPIRFDNGHEDWTLLEPVPFETIEGPPVPLPLCFSNSINSLIPVATGDLLINSPQAADSLNFNYVKVISDTVEWKHSQLSGRKWMNTTADYQIVMIDSLHRQFKTKTKQVYLKSFSTYLPLVVGLAEFNSQISFPIISLHKLLQDLKMRLKFDKNIHIRFIGHACGIPPQSVNNRYSAKRAQNFQEIFLHELNKIKTDDADLYQLISARLEQKAFLGKGASEPYHCLISKEKFNEYKKRLKIDTYAKIVELIYRENATEIQPFDFELIGRKIVLVGDNETPEGRQINRRIELELFYPDGKFVDLTIVEELN